MIGKCCEMNMRRCMQKVSKIFTILDKGMTGKQVIRYAKRFVAACMPRSFMAWWRKIYDRCFYISCPTKQAIWTEDIRNIDVAWLGEESVVYAAGVWGSMTFEVEIAKRFNAKLLVFDPSPLWKETAEKPENRNQNITFLSYWIAWEDKDVRFDVPSENSWLCYTTESDNEYIEKEVFACRSIPSLMKEFRHKKIDLLKMDIEGFEYEVLDSIFSNNLDIKQICLEFHDFFDHIPYAKTRDAIRELHARWYVCIHRNMKDYTFLRKDLL